MMKDGYHFWYLMYLAPSGVHLNVDISWESEKDDAADTAKAN